MVETARRRPMVDAVLGGLAATVGSGVFIVFSPAAGHAGRWLPVAVLLAAGAAALNARALAMLGARFPRAGTAYPPSRLLLGRWAGRSGGALLLAGLVCGVASAGRVFAEYVLPDDPLCVAIPMVVVVAVAHLAGARVGPRGVWIVTSGVVAVLVVVVLVGLTTRATTGASTGAGASLPPPGVMSGAPSAVAPAVASAPLAGPVGWAAGAGVAAAAGLVFFAFLGAAGTGMPGSPDTAQDRAARRAGTVTLLVALVLYLVVAVAVLHALGLADLVASPSPLAAAVGADPALGVLVRVGAVAATVSVALALFVGARRAVRGLARRGDLPRWFAAPTHRADAAVLLAAVLVTAFAGPTATVAVAAGCMLSYFALANLAALRLSSGPFGTGLPAGQPGLRQTGLGQTAFGRAGLGRAGLALAGMVLCVLLVVALPWPQAVVAVGIGALAGVSVLPRPGRVSWAGRYPAVRSSRLGGGQERPGPRTRCGRRRAGQR